MAVEAPVTREIKPANPSLWAVKAYIDLLSGDSRLVYGDGLKRLWTMTNGLATFNESDIIDATRKATENGLIPFALGNFMTSSIIKNCTLYAQMLNEMINQRIVSIANGDVTNPLPMVGFSPIKARRNYYLPPVSFITRLSKALRCDISASLEDLMADADFILAQMAGNEGNDFPSESAFGALTTCVEQLVSGLELCVNYPTENECYKHSGRNPLKLLWFITKLLYGDLTVKAERKDINLVDLTQKIAMSDGTLAAIPFPIKQSVNLFTDDDQCGISMKGRFYLAAVSTAAFYRGDHEEG